MVTHMYMHIVQLCISVCIYSAIAYAFAYALICICNFYAFAKCKFNAFNAYALYIDA